MLCRRTPNNGEARYLLGIALEQGGRPGRRPKSSCARPLSAGYSPDLVYPALVRVLLEQGQFEKALSEADASRTTQSGQGGAARPDRQRAARPGEACRKHAPPILAALTVEPANETATLGMARLAALERDLPRANQLVDQVLRAVSILERGSAAEGRPAPRSTSADKEAAQAYGKRSSCARTACASTSASCLSWCARGTWWGESAR